MKKGTEFHNFPKKEKRVERKNLHFIQYLRVAKPERGVKMKKLVLLNERKENQNRNYDSS